VQLLLRGTTDLVGIETRLIHDHAGASVHHQNSLANDLDDEGYVTP
jgi:hypothetical protein